MQTVIENVTAASHVIQQAVAPVFLLTGIGAILSVLTGRLGRVVDRFRVLNEKYDAAKQVLAEQPEYAKAIHELYILQCRAEWVHWAITLSTLSLLFVALVIGILFLGSAISWDLSWLVSPLFILAMLTLVLSLGCFLREITLSKHTFELPNNKNRVLKPFSKKD
ncbi:MAG: DUF2721 domain-containing protein [Methylotenera sp.]|jgi:hypothetical protein|nr:MAG: hypothetical protein CTY12_06180 [Methylotenera sp.]HOY87750.1 DUF2721 domain-containing protein [Methylotenera sp.]HPH08103.1 DUF2721 domain-containing protein [Methylotenera sp.]HPM49894.1 DUF2721 domain-containing protein [Methylotenera sp.]HQM88323.1 DUF2721 domain-containing protein [Methylotenera sp.]